MIACGGGQLQGRGGPHGWPAGRGGVAGALPVEGRARHPQTAAGTHHADLLALGRGGGYQGGSAYAGGFSSIPSQVETFFGRL